MKAPLTQKSNTGQHTIRQTIEAAAALVEQFEAKVSKSYNAAQTYRIRCEELKLKQLKEKVEPENRREVWHLESEISACKNASASHVKRELQFRSELKILKELVDIAEAHETSLEFISGNRQ